jgi:integrase
VKKPWFWKSRGRWYLDTIDGRIDLGEDKDAAFDAWAAMLASESRKATKDPTFAELAKLFLVESSGRVERGELALTTHSDYVWYLDSFTKRWPAIEVSRLEPSHVSDWMAGNPGWGSSARRHAIGSIKRVLNWGRKERRITANPIEDLARPSPRRRQAMITDDDHARLVQAAGGDKFAGKIDRQFRLALIAIRHCGGRPQDIARARVEYVDPACTKWTLPEHKTRRHTERPRVVYLSPCLTTITRMLMAGRSTGPLFRGRRGGITTNAITCRMRRLKAELGIDPAVVFYSYRHTYITEAMGRGVDVAMIAELTGTSITMIERNYGHLAAKHEHLRAAAAKAMGRKDAN